ncbi:MAG: amidohydrolase family protein [Phycisphaerales bacterium]
MTARRLNAYLGSAVVAASALATATLAAPPSTIALTGGRIIPVVGDPIPSGTVLVEDGRIIAVGTDVDIPFDATEYDVTGMVVFPGMIDPQSSGGLDVPNETLSVAPYLDVFDAIDPSRATFENYLRDGVTSVHVMQANNTVVGGISRVVRPIGLAVNEMTVATDIGIKLSTSPKSGYDRMRQMSELRETFAELGDYVERLPESVYEAWLKKNDKPLDVGPAEARRLGAELITDADYDDAHANLIRLTRGDLHGWIYCGFAMDVAPAIAVARDNDFLDGAVFVLGSTSWKAADELKRAGRPVIAPSQMYHRERDPITGEIEETFIPSVLHREGIEFSLLPSGNTSLAERYLNYQAAVCVRNGIPRQAALEAITLNPARALGLEEDMGSIEVGKRANLVVFSGDPLDFTSWVQHVFIDGIHAYDRTNDPRLAEIMKLESMDTGDMTEADAGDGDGDAADPDDADADSDSDSGTDAGDGADADGGDAR